MRALTRRQADVLWLMIDHVVRHHTHAPVRLIGSTLGIGSTNAVADHLRALERKGYVETTQANGLATRRVLRWPNGAPFLLRAVVDAEQAASSEVVTNA